jgi:phosphomethylpyrimidine synthase
MTQMESARRGRVTPEMKDSARAERITPEALRDKIAAGRAVLPVNNKRKALGLPRIARCAIGEGLRTKVNANVGTSADFAELAPELVKLRAAVESGADTVMDLSTGGDIPAIRRRILEASPVAVGTVPIYDVAVDCMRAPGTIGRVRPAQMLDAVRRHAEQGVDFVTVHCGVTRDVVRCLERAPRVCGIVSRGGSFLAAWMALRGKENPLYEQFDEVLALCREHDVTLSLGDGLRPGALADAMDRAQVHELNVLAELVQRAREAGVQAMVEGPGHVPLNQVQAQVRMQKELCRGAPFYVLGPLVTDVAPGYDHITAAIGGAVAGAAGVDFICYVTPTEHLGLPAEEHVREGVIAARIAGHAADIAKGVPGAAEWDIEFSKLRQARDWEGQLSRCIDPRRARALRHERRPARDEVCSMCGDLCVFKISDDIKARARK